MGTATMNSIPFVTTTLEVRWIPVDVATRFGDYAYFGGDEADAEAGESLPYFRCTASVAAWFNRKMAIAMDRADSGDCNLAAALLESGAVDRYWVISNWADREYGADVVAAARPELPKVEPLPPRDAPPADPVVWSGAFDDAKVNRPAPAATLANGVTISIPRNDMLNRSRAKARSKATNPVSLFGEA